MFTKSFGSNEEKATSKRPTKPGPKDSDEESSKPESSSKPGPKASNEEGSSEKEKPVTQNPKRDPDNPESSPPEDGPWFINPPTGPPDSVQVIDRKIKKIKINIDYWLFLVMKCGKSRLESDLLNFLNVKF